MKASDGIKMPQHLLVTTVSVCYNQVSFNV